MRKISLFLGAILVAFCSLFLISCGEGSDDQKQESKKPQIVMITDTGDISDKSFNQGTWEGIKKFTQDNHEKVSEPIYIKPTVASPQGYEEAIKTAVDDKNATVIVTPGYMFQEPVTKMSETYPNVKFIILDAVPTTLRSNTYSIMFKEQQSGFLAGYAAVKEGLNKIGFIGGIAVPAVVHYGAGFIAGIYYANHEAGTTPNFDENYYQYVNQFTPDPKFQTQANSWYTTGNLDVIFAAAGGVGTNVITAANALDGKYSIGVDSNQAYLGKSVITSAIKNLQLATYNALEGAIGINNKTFNGGKSDLLGLTSDANNVGLAPSTSDGWKFKHFTLEQYKAITDKIINGDFVVPNDSNSLKTFIESLSMTVPTALIAKIQ